MRNKNLLAGLLLAFAVLIIGSCGQKKIYSHYEHLDNSGWDKADTLHFGIPPVVEGGLYSGEMGMRIGLDFPYENLVVDVTETIYPSRIQKTYTLDCTLTEQSGQWKGAGVNYIQYLFPVGSIQLHAGDSVHYAISHKMKRIQIPCVYNVGINLSQQ
jgi:gliding motility-associated lipoprotein GldH